MTYDDTGAARDFNISIHTPARGVTPGRIQAGSYQRISIHTPARGVTYGSVLRAQDLMEARENIRLLDYQVFPAGIVVATPEVAAPAATDDLPEWRK